MVGRRSRGPGHTVAPSMIVDYQFMLAHERAPHVKLVDARGLDVFAGPYPADPTHRAIPGHIPGAINIPFDSLYTDSNLVKGRAELERKFRDAGVQPGDTIVGYCYVGQQATAMLFVARMLGFPTRLYDGSMDDWNARHLPRVGLQQP